MVAGLEAELGPLADLADDDRVLLGHPVWRIGIGQVGQSRRQRVSLLLDIGQLRLQDLQPSCQLTHLRDRLLGLAAGALRRGDRFARLVLSRPSLLDLGEQLATARVEAEQLVDLVGDAAAFKSFLDALRLGPDQLKVEHCWAAVILRLAAGVLGDESGHGFRLLADDDVLRHDRAREAAVLDREQRILGVRLWSRSVSARTPRLPVPWLPAASSVWQPEQWVAKRTAPS